MAMNHLSHFQFDGDNLEIFNKFALKGDYPEVKTLQKRPGDYLWYIWKGFNTKEAGGNKLFNPILVHFAQIRLGITPVRCDEVGAMSEAIIMDYLTEGKAAGDLKAKVACPKKDWLYPILHAINLHIRYFTNLPMLVMSDEADIDRKLQHTERKTNTSILMIDYHEEPTEAGIERRDEVRKELVKFISLHTGESEEDVISMIPPVHGGTTEDPIHSRKRKARRRSFDQVGSDESDA